MEKQIHNPRISAENHKKMIQNVAGTMAIEGINLSKASIRNLERYASGQADYQQLLAEMKAKYQRVD